VLLLSFENQNCPVTFFLLSSFLFWRWLLTSICLRKRCLSLLRPASPTILSCHSLRTYAQCVSPSGLLTFASDVHRQSLKLRKSKTLTGSCLLFEVKFCSPSLADKPLPHPVQNGVAASSPCPCPAQWVLHSWFSWGQLFLFMFRSPLPLL
jgi:hypothetical protein